MISRLRGILIAKHAPIAIIEALGSGVAYEVFLPINSFYLLGEIGSEIMLQTHFIVRENEQALYGFLEEKQRALFRTLIKVNGIGPKLALTILSSVDPEVLVQSIVRGEASELTRINGIGTKTAQRIMMELRDKVEDMQSDLARDIGASTTVRDAISALIALGYKPNQAQQAIAKHKDKQLPSEDLVRLALRDM